MRNACHAKRLEGKGLVVAIDILLQHGALTDKGESTNICEHGKVPSSPALVMSSFSSGRVCGKVPSLLRRISFEHKVVYFLSVILETRRKKSGVINLMRGLISMLGTKTLPV